MSSLAFAPSRMGPAYAPAPWSVVVPGTGAVVQAIPGDPNRVLLTMISTGAATVQFFPGGLSYINAAWIQSTATVVMTWTYHDYGPLVGLPWYARTATGGATIGGIVMSYDPSSLGNAIRPVDPAGNLVPKASPILPPPYASIPELTGIGKPQYNDPAHAALLAQQVKIRQQMLRQQFPNA